jgi:hypothetical protein
MAGARHALRVGPRSSRRLANALCATAVGVGIATTQLPSSALGYADTPVDGEVLLGTGDAVVGGLLYPGGSVTGTLTVANGSPYDAQVTGVVFDVPVVDAQHRGCDPRGVVLTTAAPLPRVASGATPTQRTITFTATMDRAVGDACQGAGFTSGYRITARPV